MEKNNIPLEFVTTACNRSGILQKTYESFTSKLKNVDFKKSTLYINIDPIPNNHQLERMTNISQNYFGNVIINNPKEPNFAKAVKWCISQPKGKYVFYLEDDWELSTDVDIHDLINIMENDQNIKEVQLRKLVISNELPENTDVFGFPPGLWNSEFLKMFSQQMVSNINPEVQIIHYQRKLRKENNPVKKTIFGKEPIIYDIGRIWLNQKNLTRDYGNDQNKWTPWITWKNK